MRCHISRYVDWTVMRGVMEFLTKCSIDETELFLFQHSILKEIHQWTFGKLQRTSFYFSGYIILDL